MPKENCIFHLQLYKSDNSLWGFKKVAIFSGNLTKNKCSSDCCPSKYSCDNGCICMNKKQIELVKTRGGN